MSITITFSITIFNYNYNCQLLQHSMVKKYNIKHNFYGTFIDDTIKFMTQLFPHVIVTSQKHQFLKSGVRQLASVRAEDLPGNGEKSLYRSRRSGDGEVLTRQVGELGVPLFIFFPVN